MRRALVLGAIVGAGALSMGVTAWTQAQRTITLDKVNDNLYVLRGGGGNTAAFITTDGVVVVDAKNPGWGQSILDKIREVTPKPVTTLINTHAHGDHVSGNVEFAPGVTVVAHEATKALMEKMPIFTDNANRGIPSRTFTDRLTLGSGADAVQLLYFGPGHTGGDAIVVFPALRAAHFGDLFAGKGLSLVDADSGGSALHYNATLRKAYTGIANVDTIVNGHLATTTTWDDLRVFTEFHDDVLAWMKAEVAAGKSPDEAAKAWTLPAKYAEAGYSANVSSLFGGMAGRFRRLAEEMKRP
jgi:glyoxylase-like metal-dependent hydrolase (beta-lactamase superfamily II)